MRSPYKLNRRSRKRIKLMVKAKRIWNDATWAEIDVVQNRLMR